MQWLHQNKLWRSSGTIRCQRSWIIWAWISMGTTSGLRKRFWRNTNQLSLVSNLTRTFLLILRLRFRIADLIFNGPLHRSILGSQRGQFTTWWQLMATHTCTTWGLQISSLWGATCFQLSSGGWGWRKPLMLFPCIELTWVSLRCRQRVFRSRSSRIARGPKAKTKRKRKLVKTLPMRKRRKEKRTASSRKKRKVGAQSSQL